MLIEIPKAPHGRKESLPYTLQQKYEKITVRMNYGNYCLECDEEIIKSDHFMYVRKLPIFIYLFLIINIYRGQLKCSKCFYVTSCQRAMFDHAFLCGTSSYPTNNSLEFNLTSEMHCICGFSSANGNCLAKHLLTCHHSSVYPSYESAQENIAKKNMLDMLGLVRRDGEVTPEPQTESVPVSMEDFQSVEESSNQVEGQSFSQQLRTKELFEGVPEIVHNQNIITQQQVVVNDIHINQGNVVQIGQACLINQQPVI